MKKILLFLACALMSVAGVQAPNVKQFTVQGQVISKQDKTPLQRINNDKALLVSLEKAAKDATVVKSKPQECEMLDYGNEIEKVPPGDYKWLYSGEQLLTEYMEEENRLSNILSAEKGHPLAEPLSTFSIDVDAASYTKVRSLVNHGANVPVYAVRSEELINFFKYDYPAPKGDDIVSITTEVNQCPWNKDNRLVHIGLRAKDEARRVLGDEFAGTILTLAKDVKLQVEFNPRFVQNYRLIGYEARALEAKDFVDDSKYAGQMGVGHTVTALYEIVPVGVHSNLIASVDELKYQKEDKKTVALTNSPEMLTVKMRYKKPDSDQSQLFQTALIDHKEQLDNASVDFRFSAAVAAYAMLLTKSPLANGFTAEQVIELAQNARGEDPEGYRAEFIRLVKATKF